MEVGGNKAGAKSTDDENRCALWTKRYARVRALMLQSQEENRTQNLEGASGDAVTSPAETRVRGSNSCVTRGNLTSPPASLSAWVK